MSEGAGVATLSPRVYVISTTAPHADYERVFLARPSLAEARRSHLAVWTFLVTYGPRRGEVCGLRWKNVDLEAKRVDIVETRIVVDGHPQASEPKTLKGNRSITLTEADVAMFKAHRACQLEERMKLGLGKDDDGYVFTDKVGEPISPDWLSRRFLELAGEVEPKLPRLTVHGVRHTAVSVMRHLGLPPEVIAATLGHSGTRVLFEVYRHLHPAETAVVGEVMGEALRNRDDKMMTSESAGDQEAQGTGH
jgi:integrase